MPVSAQIALERLREGNRRFLTGRRIGAMSSDVARLAALSERQAPVAAVLGCADSRVPPEIVLDQRTGDLFTVRVAGSVATPSQIDSIEFAVGLLGCPLVLVLGHNGCGAVAAALDSLGQRSTPMESVLGPMRAAIEPALAAAPGATGREREQLAVRATIRAAMEALYRGSTALARKVEAGELRIVGGWCELESGRLVLLDEPDGG